LSTIEVFSDKVKTSIWYHVVAAYKGSMLTLYLDGQKINYMNWFTVSVNTSGLPLTIGRLRSDYAMYGFKGTVDDVRIYKRVLTESQIKDLYHEGGWTK
jgi:hypothetical protein